MQTDGQSQGEMQIAVDTTFQVWSDVVNYWMPAMEAYFTGNVKNVTQYYQVPSADGSGHQIGPDPSVQVWLRRCL